MTRQENFLILSNLLERPPKGKGVGRELMLLKRLVTKVPNEDFWLNYKPKKKFESLVFLSGPWGEKLLKKAEKAYNLKGEFPEFEQVKFDLKDETTTVRKKIKTNTIKDILNG